MASTSTARATSCGCCASWSPMAFRRHPSCATSTSKNWTSKALLPAGRVTRGQQLGRESIAEMLASICADTVICTYELSAGQPTESAGYPLAGRADHGLRAGLRAGRLRGLADAQHFLRGARDRDGVWPRLQYRAALSQLLYRVDRGDRQPRWHRAAAGRACLVQSAAALGALEPGARDEPGHHSRGRTS